MKKSNPFNKKYEKYNKNNISINKKLQEFKTILKFKIITLQKIFLSIK